MFVQSFEVGNLRDLSTQTDVPLVQLLNAGGQPWDFTVSGDTQDIRRYGHSGWAREIATYADGIGANKNLIIPRGQANQLLEPTSLISDAHRAGLVVHAWTFRAENTFLPTNFQRGSDQGASG